MAHVPVLTQELIRLLDVPLRAGSWTARSGRGTRGSHGSLLGADGLLVGCDRDPWPKVLPRAGR